MNYRDIAERAIKPRSLAHALALDESVGKRGVPSLPKLKFMEGLGPEDPRFDAAAMLPRTSYKESDCDAHSRPA